MISTTVRYSIIDIQYGGCRHLEFIKTDAFTTNFFTKFGCDFEWQLIYFIENCLEPEIQHGDCCHLEFRKTDTVIYTSNANTSLITETWSDLHSRYHRSTAILKLKDKLPVQLWWTNWHSVWFRWQTSSQKNGKIHSRHRRKALNWNSSWRQIACSGNSVRRQSPAAR